MDQYIIKGGNPLVGEVEIGGAKNAALAILAAAIMTDDTVRLENLPDVNDINVLLEAIGGIGAKVERVDRHTAVINGSTIGDISVDISRKSVHPIICWVHFSENIKKQKYLCRVAVTSEAARLTCI